MIETSVSQGSAASQRPERAADIDAYLGNGLSARRVAPLRAHLRGCDPCRSYYDAQVSLLRALAGRVDVPTLQESQRLTSEIIARVASVRAPGRSILERLGDAVVWSPARAAVVAAAVLVMVGVIADLARLAPTEPRRAKDLVSVGPTVPASIPSSPAMTPGIGVAATLPAPLPIGRLVVATDVRFAGHPAKVSAVVKTQTDISTGSSGLAELHLTGGGVIRLQPATEIVLTNGGQQIELLQGKIWCEAGAGHAFTVSTSHVTASAIGASFVVNRSDRRTVVRAMSGNLTVRGVRGHVKLAAGEETEVGVTTAPSKPSHFSAQSETSAWDRFFAGLLHAFKQLFGIH